MRVFTALALAAAVSTPALAGEKELVDYRKANMDIVGAHMHSIVALVKGEAPYAEQLAAHAAALADASRLISGAFRDRAMTDKSTAKDAIWSERAKFEDAADALIAAADKLSMAARGEDMGAIGAALGGVGKACKGCHKAFRVKK